MKTDLCTPEDIQAITGMSEDQFEFVKEWAEQYVKEISEKRSASTKRLWEDPKYRIRATCSMILAHSDPGVKAAHRALMKRLWTNPKYAQKVISALSTPEALTANRERVKKLWDDPKYVAKIISARNTPEAKHAHRIGLKKRWIDQEYRDKWRHAVKLSHNTEEYKSSQRNLMRKLLKDPEYVHKRTKAQNTPEYKSMISEWSNKLWANPEYAAKMRRIRQCLPKYRLGTSVFKGVSWSKRYHKWRVVIRVNGKHKHIGLFNDEVNAAIAYNNSALKYFGPHAYQNPIPCEPGTKEDGLAKAGK